MLKDDGCMTKKESGWGYGFALLIFIGCAFLSISLAGCASSQKAPDRIDNTCPEYFKPLYIGCDTAYSELEAERASIQAALERCNRTLNKNLSKSR